MEGSVCFVTKKGLVFKNASQARTQELIADIERLKAGRAKGMRYTFIVHFDDESKIEAEDVLIAIGADVGNF